MGEISTSVILQDVRKCLVNFRLCNVIPSPEDASTSVSRQHFRDRGDLFKVVGLKNLATTNKH